jgi:hypothetical protein
VLPVCLLKVSAPLLLLLSAKLPFNKGVMPASVH